MGMNVEKMKEKWLWPPKIKANGKGTSLNYKQTRHWEKLPSGLHLKIQVDYMTFLHFLLVLATKATSLMAATMALLT